MSVRKFVILSGGLGNQLLQFAFAHKLSKLSSVTLVEIRNKADSKFSTRSNHLLLDATKKCRHNVNYEVWDQSDIKTRMNFVTESRYFRFNLWKNRALDLRGTLWTRFGDYSLEDFELFLGSFQSISFLGIEIQAVLTEIDEVLTSMPFEITNEIHGYKGFVHVRGKDYLEDRHRGHFGVLDSSYYERLTGLIPGDFYKDYLIITDDTSRVNKILPQVNNANLISSDSHSEVATLGLMRKAQIACIANSSFSWWGGLLAKRNGGKVFAPFPWFRAEFLNIAPVSDLYYEDMKIVESSYSYDEIQ